MPERISSGLVSLKPPFLPYDDEIKLSKETDAGACESRANLGQCRANGRHDDNIVVVLCENGGFPAGGCDQV